MITVEDVKKNEEVQALIEGTQRQLNVLGYTEHSTRHISIVSHRAAEILRTFGYGEDRIELAKIAGYLHDIGNCVNRVDHAHSGALLAYVWETLKGNMPKFERIEPYELSEYMILDASTRKNLELTETLREKNKYGSLL